MQFLYVNLTMVKMFLTPPKTIMEVYEMLPEGTLAELIDGRIYMTPPPNLEHQQISMTIAGEIYIAKKNKKLRGKVFTSPIGVFLDESENAIQPDIVFLSNRNKSRLREDAIHGSPDVIVEILSPGNKKHDLETKKALYEAFKIKEYWIVDPELHEAVGYQIVRGIYREFFRGVGTMQSNILKKMIRF
jgi:Uma2 family endonuclease